MLSVKKKKRISFGIFLIVLLIGILGHYWLSEVNVVIKNYGISFGLDGWILIGLSIVLVLVLAVFWLRNYDYGSGLMLIGGMINLVDRFVFGYVRDYWKIGWVYNNLADWIIQAGVIIFLSQLWTKKLK